MRFEGLDAGAREVWVTEARRRMCQPFCLSGRFITPTPALGLFTPHDVHYGLAEAKRDQRARVFAEAFAKHPERFPNGRPSPRPLPIAVWINQPKAHVVGEGAKNTMTSELLAIAAKRAFLDISPSR
jgi:hypothetical protein